MHQREIITLVEGKCHLTLMERQIDGETIFEGGGKMISRFLMVGKDSRQNLRGINLIPRDKVVGLEWPKYSRSIWLDKGFYCYKGNLRDRNVHHEIDLVR